MTAATACPNPITGANHSSWATYNTSNQLTANSTVANFLYDDAGNITNDGTNKYVYDLDGRICAVTTVAAGGAITQYVYDAEGRRVAKGALTTFPAAGKACFAPTAANGFSLTGAGAALYLRGEHGDQDTELDGTGVWRHTNVFAGGGLTATYDTGTKATLSFNYSDWLGSKRAQSAFGGAAQNSWASDPYGAYLKALGSGADATEQHFTGKERDSESGLDNFGARYFASSLGRFITPDWVASAVPVPYAHFGNPQSLNLYGYAGNSPTTVGDPDGHQEEKDPIEEKREDDEDFRELKEAYERWKERESEERAIEYSRPDKVIANNNNDDPVTGVCYLKTPTHEEAVFARQAKTFPDLYRPYIRQSVRQAVEGAAPRTADGRFIDPNTGRPIDGKPDLGHKPGNEFWREKEKAEGEGLTQKQFNDRMNKSGKYQLEDAKSNRSHKYEQKQPEKKKD
jgi:RHS repeat-associated protein